MKNAVAAGCLVESMLQLKVEDSVGTWASDEGCMVSNTPFPIHNVFHPFSGREGGHLDDDVSSETNGL